MFILTQPARLRLVEQGPVHATAAPAPRCNVFFSPKDDWDVEIFIGIPSSS